MKKLLLGLLLCALSCVFSSCDKEDDEIGDENTVTWEILASDANASLLFDCSYTGETIQVSTGYKYTYKTHLYWAGCTVKCDDQYVKIKVKGYLNGKLKLEKEESHYIHPSFTIK